MKIYRILKNFLHVEEDMPQDEPVQAKPVAPVQTKPAALAAPMPAFPGQPQPAAPAAMSAEEPLSSFDIRDGVLVQYLGNRNHVIVPEGVHTIGAWAFSRVETVRHVSLHPDTSDIENVPPMFRDQYMASDACGTVEHVTYTKEKKGLRFVYRVTLPEGVTTICDHAFCDCYWMTRVDLPQSLRTIGERAFEFCNKLNEIEIPSGLRELGKHAFCFCKSLKSLILPKEMAYIGEGAFFGCESLETVQIPENLGKMGSAVFYECKQLRSVDIPHGITTIPHGTFQECFALERVSLPNTVTVIDNGAFFRCGKLHTINLPDSLERIGAQAFNKCFALEQLDLPPRLKSVGEGAFWGCGVKELHFPASIEGKIPSCVDEHCENLTQITLRTPVEWSFGAKLRGMEHIEHIFVSRAIYEEWDARFDGCLKTKFPKVELLDEEKETL